MPIHSNKIDAISEIFKDIAQVIFGIMLVAPAVTKPIDLKMIATGAIFSLTCWIISIIIKPQL